MSIYIMQLIYIKPGEEKTFLEFEDIAMPLISKYNGRLLLRVRPSKTEIVEANIPPPYEIHLIEFDADDDLRRAMLDEERKKFLHLKEQSIQSSWFIKGVKL